MKATTVSSIEILENRVAPAGVVNVVLIGTVLALTGDAQANVLTIHGLDNGTVDLVPDAGTIIHFQGADSSGTVNVHIAASNVVAKLGMGDDNLTLLGVLRTVMVDLGKGTNTLTVGGLSVAGKMTINGGADNDTVTFSAGTPQRLGAAVDINLGAGGADKIHFNNANEVLGGNWTIRKNGGVVDIDATSHALLFEKNLTLMSGAGQINFESHDTAVIGVVGTVKALTQQGGGVFLSLGTSADAGNLSLGAVVGTGPGLVNIELIALSVSVTHDIKVAVSSFCEIGGDRVHLGGNVVVGGAVTIHNFDQSVAGLVVAGGIKAKGLIVEGSGVIGGKVISLGSTGFTASGGQLQFSQPVFISTTATGVFPVVTISGVTFDSTVKIATGTGNEIIVIDDVLALGAFTITTGAGNDTVKIETTAGSLGTSQFLGALNITLGDGTDTATIGANTATQKAATFASFMVDGGLGTGDTLSLAPNGNNILVPAVITGFETGT